MRDIGGQSRRQAAGQLRQRSRSSASGRPRTARSSTSWPAMGRIFSARLLAAGWHAAYRRRPGHRQTLEARWHADPPVRCFGALHASAACRMCGGVHALAIDREGKLLAAGGTAPQERRHGRRLADGGAFSTSRPAKRAQAGTGRRQRLLYVADIRFHDEGFLSAVTYGTPGAGQFLYVVPEEKTPVLHQEAGQLPTAYRGIPTASAWPC